MSFSSLSKYNTSLRPRHSSIEKSQLEEDYEVDKAHQNVLDYFGMNFSTNPQRRYQFNQILSSSFQTALFMFLEWVPLLIQLYFIGKTASEAEISGFGMGLMWSNCFAVGIFGGIGVGVETLASFSFGAQKFKMTGIFFQKGVSLVSVCMIFIIFLMFYSEQCLMFLIGNEEISKNSALYCKYGIIAFYFSGIYNICKGFLTAQNEYQLPLIAVCFSTSFSLIIFYICIDYLQMGIIGAAVGRTFVDFINLFVVLRLCVRKNIHEKFGMYITKAAFKQWGHFLTYIIPIGSLLTLEWLSYELFTMQAACLEMHMFNAHVIMNNVNTVYYQFGYGISIALTTYVGNEMGSKCINKAKDFSKQGMTLLGIFLVGTQIPLFLIKGWFIYIFTNDEKTVQVLSDNFMLFQFIMCMDSVLASVTGITRGIGKQNLAASSFIISYLFIGQIVANFCAFNLNMGISGIWMGIIFGILCTSGAQIYVIIKSDWKILLEKIQEDLQKEDKKNQELIQEEEMLEEKLNVK